MKHELKMYVVEIKNRFTEEHSFEWQEAYSVQKAVDKVRGYNDPDEYEVVEVYKVMCGWK